MKSNAFIVPLLRFKLFTFYKVKQLYIYSQDIIIIPRRSTRLRAPEDDLFIDKNGKIRVPDPESIDNSKKTDRQGHIMTIGKFVDADAEEMPKFVAITPWGQLAFKNIEMSKEAVVED